MPETENLKVTFDTSLPMGERGTFTHDGDLWIAYRAKKNQRIFAVTDRLIGIHRAIQNDMLGWINDWPTDAARVAMVLERVNRGLTLHKELIYEKTEAAIS